jgi:serine/threonine-protein kinase RsbW
MDTGKHAADDCPTGVTRFQLALPTDLAQLAAAVETVVCCCERAGELSDRARFRLRTVAAEALANAMAYGNNNEVHRQVAVELQIECDRLKFGVTDEGNGFDPRKIPEPTGPDCHDALGGRGLYLIRMLTEQVSFNERGNSIWMTLPLR